VTRPRTRRRVFYILGITALATLGWAARCAQLSRAVYHELRVAQTHLGVLRYNDAVHSLVNGESSDLDQAQASLRRARTDLMSPWFWPVRAIPLVSRQFDSALALTGTTSTIVDLAVDTGRVLSPTRRASLDRAQVLTELTSLSSRLGLVLHRPQLGPSTMLVPQLDRARAQLAAQIEQFRPTVDRANVTLPGLTSLANGPRRYLVVAANNAEMAAGAGLPLAVATVDIDHGNPTFADWKWSGDLTIPGDGVPMTAELASLWSFASPNGDLRRALVSPRFATTAPLLAAEYEAATGTKVDGVVLIDIVGLQKIVAAGGKTVDGTSLSATQIIPELLHDQYIAIDGTRIGSHQQREEKLSGQAAQAAALLLAPTTDPLKLARGLADAVAGRHVLMWSASADEQHAFAALGADGALTEQSVMVNLQNVASNKLDWFARLSSSFSVERLANGDQHVTVQVTIVNNVPDGEPAYVAGPSSAARHYGQYVGYLTLHVPGAATDVHLGSASPVIVSGPDGPTRLIGQIVAIEKDQTYKVTFHFTLSAGTSVVRVEPSARFPSVSWTAGDDQWIDDRAHRILLPL
jgi:Protein of unknown function (DUF4012)